MSEWNDRRKGMSGNWAWFVLLALLQPLAAIAEKPLPMYELQATGEIRIGPDGHVRDYELKSDLSPAIAELVDRQVRGWTFEPILVEGRPVIAKTRMQLSLKATPSGNGKYALRIAHVEFGEPARAHQITPPRYPERAVRAGLGAKVTLVLRLDPQGNVVDVFPEQTSLTAPGSERVANKWRRIFEKSSIAAARKWKFAITETIGGRPIGSMIRVPVTFRLDGERETPELWQAFVPGPIQPVPWLVDPDSLAAGSERDALEDGDVQSLSSRFKLKQDVVGMVL